MNDTRNPSVQVQAGKTYFLRIINISGFAQYYFHIDQHNFTIVETDGIYTEPREAGDLFIANGQRYGVLLKTRSTATQNYAMLGMMDPNGFDPTVPAPIENNVTGVLVYNREFHVLFRSLALTTSHSFSPNSNYVTSS